MNYQLHTSDGRIATIDLSKEREGWMASTRIELEDMRVLRVTTRKKIFGASLATSASVCTVDGHSEIHVLAPGLSGDFRQTCIERVLPRITEKAVREQHERFLREPGALANLLCMVERHYAAQAARSAEQAHKDCEVSHG